MTTIQLTLNEQQYTELLLAAEEAGLTPEWAATAIVVRSLKDGGLLFGLRSGNDGMAHRCPPSDDIHFKRWLETWSIPDCQESRKMADYFAAKPGKGGRKVDWTATWRNWARKAGVQFTAPRAKVRTVKKPNPIRPGETISEHQAFLQLDEEGLALRLESEFDKDDDG